MVRGPPGHAPVASVASVAPPTFVAPLGPDAGVLEEEAAAPKSTRRRRLCGTRSAGDG